MTARTVVDPTPCAASDAEASRILLDIVGHLAFVRPMADGRVLLEIEADDALLERMGVWRSHLADLEPDADEEHDARELPRLTEAPAVVVVQPAATVPAQATPALDRLVSLKWVPPEMRALAARADAAERLAA